MSVLRIGTHSSQLALWQAIYVRDNLMKVHHSLEVELVKITTTGDRVLNTPLAASGGKGLFLKELEQALLDRHIDLAVHSMKDVTVTLPEGLVIDAICERADPTDAFVSNRYSDIEDLPLGAVVGTCSQRRQCVLRHWRPDLKISDLRGNVNTRLKKLDAGEFDAIILASAGLRRLDMAERIAQSLATQFMLPAVAQGAVGIETREDDYRVRDLVGTLNHAPTRSRVRAERAANARLGGGCHVPVAIYSEIIEEEITVDGIVGMPDGSKLISGNARGVLSEPELVGEALAEKLLAQGAAELLSLVNA